MSLRLGGEAPAGGLTGTNTRAELSESWHEVGCSQHSSFPVEEPDFPRATIEPKPRDIQSFRNVYHPVPFNEYPPWISDAVLIKDVAVLVNERDSKIR